MHYTRTSQKCIGLPWKVRRFSALKMLSLVYISTDVRLGFVSKEKSVKVSIHAFSQFTLHLWNKKKSIFLATVERRLARHLTKSHDLHGFCADIVSWTGCYNHQLYLNVGCVASRCCMCLYFLVSISAAGRYCSPLSFYWPLVTFCHLPVSVRKSITYCGNSAGCGGWGVAR